MHVTITILSQCVVDIIIIVTGFDVRVRVCMRMRVQMNVLCSVDYLKNFM